jgi:hypothetical protein
MKLTWVSNKEMGIITLAEDAASANEPLNPFAVTKPFPEKLPDIFNITKRLYLCFDQKDDTQQGSRQNTCQTKLLWTVNIQS